MKKLFIAFTLGLVTIFSLAASNTVFAMSGSSSQAAMHMKHMNFAATRLHSVGNSGVEGFASLRQLKTKGASISLIAFGLNPEHNYVSLYYGNHACALEPYSADDVIGGIYTANRVGVGVTHGNADDDLDEINSVSVRDADTFKLLACGDVHP
jgi:hypothetical protein